MSRLGLLIFFIALPVSFIQCQSPQKEQLPKGFVELRESDLGVYIDLRYAGSHNFMGRPVDGYEGMQLRMTEATRDQLFLVVEELKERGLTLKIYDAYRPQKAVNDFITWSKVASDTIAKEEFYPNIRKDQLFERGYIAERSGHSRGSTVDLTLAILESGEVLDMGSSYDFFGEISHVEYQGLSEQAKVNRTALQKVMLKHGFKPYAEEWWHFTLKEEPFPDTYFDF